MSARVLGLAFTFSKAEKGDRLVMLALADSAADTGVCDESQEVIAAKSRLSVATVRRALRKLEELGEVQTRQCQAGRRRVNVYRVMFAGVLPIEEPTRLYETSFDEPLTGAQNERSSVPRALTHERSSTSARGLAREGSELQGQDQGQEKPPPSPPSGEGGNDDHLWDVLIVDENRVRVRGSSEPSYIVKRDDGGGLACTCAAFRFHSACKHIERAAEALRRDDELAREQAKARNGKRRSGQLVQSVGGLTVPPREYDDAVEILGAFNAKAGSSFTGREWIAAIIMRMRENPTMAAADFAAVVERAFEHDRWWERRGNGRATPSVIFGNGKVFDMAKGAKPGVTQASVFPDGVSYDYPDSFDDDGNLIDRSSRPAQNG